ncbi:hypothetical protein [Kaistia sp. 32K]|uniref:hypothetical protein n=1 Tax=Kaistia sp. 32K TaxID=2795690 RepID=UPI001916633B|nr:hypothetical protein [Kaistia sp. 32K]
MLTIYLLAYVCSTAAQDDCEAQVVDHFHGADAAITCELEREAWLDGKRGSAPLRNSRFVTLACELD